MRRVLAGMVALMALGSMLVAAPADAGLPAEATFSDDIDLRLRAGTLTIVGGNEDNFVVVCPGDDGMTYISIVTMAIDQNPTAWTTQAFAVTKDIRVLLGGGFDIVNLDCNLAEESAGTTPRDVLVNLGQGEGAVRASEVGIGDDLTLIGSNFSESFVLGPNVTVADDAILRGGAGRSLVGIIGMEVGDRLDIATGRGDSTVNVEEFSAARLSVRGGQQEDNVRIGEGDAGHNPRVLTLGGRDFVRIQEPLGATGRFLVSTGAGPDNMQTNIDATERDFTFNVLLGAHDDILFFREILELSKVGDRFNGGPGTDTRILPFGAEDFGPGTYVGFEVDDQEPG